GNKFTFTAKERRVVDSEKHAHRRLIDRDTWQRFRLIRIGDSITNLEVFNTRDGTNFTRIHFSYFYTAKAFEYMKFFNFYFFDAAIFLAKRHIGTFFQGATEHTSDSNTANERRVIQRSDLQLRNPLVCRRSRNMLKDGIQ